MRRLKAELQHAAAFAASTLLPPVQRAPDEAQTQFPAPGAAAKTFLSS